MTLPFLYVIERTLGNCFSYRESLWLLVVTSTNLGYGDVLASSLYSKFFLAWTSVFGVALCGLLVGILSEILVLPPTENRILSFVTKNKILELRKASAACLIQAYWRRYRAYKQLEAINNKLNSHSQSIPDLHKAIDCNSPNKDDQKESVFTRLNSATSSRKHSLAIENLSFNKKRMFRTSRLDESHIKKTRFYSDTVDAKKKRSNSSGSDVEDKEKKRNNTTGTALRRNHSVNSAKG